LKTTKPFSSFRPLHGSIVSLIPIILINKFSSDHENRFRGGERHQGQLQVDRRRRPHRHRQEVVGEGGLHAGEDKSRHKLRQRLRHMLDHMLRHRLRHFELFTRRSSFCPTPLASVYLSCLSRLLNELISSAAKHCMSWPIAKPTSYR